MKSMFGRKRQRKPIAVDDRSKAPSSRGRRGVFGRQRSRTQNIGNGLMIAGAGLQDAFGDTRGNVQSTLAQIDGRENAAWERQQYEQEMMREQQQAAQEGQHAAARQSRLSNLATKAGLDPAARLAMELNAEEFGKSFSSNYEAANVAEGAQRVFGTNRDAITNERPDEFVSVAGRDDVHAFNKRTGDVSALGIGNEPRSAGVTVNNNPASGPISTPPTAFEKKRDEAFAQTYIDWTTGGGADAASQLSKITDVVARMDAGENLTGLDIGLQPRIMRAFTNPNSLDAQEVVEEVVQRNLRLILGAQFTAQEGERLIARAYNPNLPEAQNRKRLGRLLQQMETSAQQTEVMAQHVEKYGTLNGYEGQTPRMQQFYDALDDESGGGNSPQAFEGQARIPDAAANMLLQNPSMASDFDAKYGPGASQRVLGGR